MSLGPPSRFTERFILIRHGIFVLCLSVPAYVAWIRTLARFNVMLTPYHRAGLFTLCLLGATSIMVLPGLFVIGVSWIVEEVRSRRNRAE